MIEAIRPFPEAGKIPFKTLFPDEASTLYQISYLRNKLETKTEYGIISKDEKKRLKEINLDFKKASRILSKLRNIPEEEADNLLTETSVCEGMTGFDEAIERLTKGPKISGFENNEEISNALKASFGPNALLEGRIMEIAQKKGFLISCPYESSGSICVERYGAKWQDGLLLAPDENSGEKIEMFLEHKNKPEELSHSFRLRAVADSTNGHTNIKVYEFNYGKFIDFDYMRQLLLPEQDKTKVRFFGCIAHEVMHGIKAFKLDKQIFKEYQMIAVQEHSKGMTHKFVTDYVDRYIEPYKRNNDEAYLASEDLPEAVRIYLSNSDYLKYNYPRRYAFIKRHLPYVKENAILEIVSQEKQ
jgi:hypothetical protein